jgi:hypothetical protein
MKNTIKLLLLFIGVTSYAQLGIGIEPAELTNEELQVKGELIITQKVGQTGEFPPLEEFRSTEAGIQTTDFRVIAIDPNSESINGQAVKGRVKELHDQKNVLPIIIQPYHVKNIHGDDLTSLNLQIPTSDYYVVITNFEAVDNYCQGFYEAQNTNNKGRFEYFVFESDGNWHVKIGNPHLSPAILDNAFEYYFDIIIYPNRFFKDLGEKIYPNVGQNGSASEPIVK